MNREIKFRIWDDAPEKDGYAGVMINHEYAIQSDYLKDALAGRYPIMQYVGKIGANECEIWEGDIVKATLNHHGKPTSLTFNAYIKYNSYVGTWQICYKNINEDFVTDDIGFRYFLEVIGNIHENPDLLNNGDLG